MVTLESPNTDDRSDSKVCWDTPLVLITVRWPTTKGFTSISHKCSAVTRISFSLVQIQWFQEVLRPLLVLYMVLCKFNFKWIKKQILPINPHSITHNDKVKICFKNSSQVIALINDIYL